MMHHRRVAGRWRAVRVETLEDFAALFRSSQQAGVVLCVYDALRARNATHVVDGMMLMLESDDGYEAVKLLSQLPGRRIGREVLRIMTNASEPKWREIAAHFFTFDRRCPPAAVLNTMQNLSEQVDVRAQAAEALAEFLASGSRRRHGLGANPRNRRHRRILRALLDGLRDPLPQIRFWCAFALGKSRFQPAIGHLRWLAQTDTTICPNWWKVSDEAADAIAVIEGRDVPPRRRLGS